MAIRNFYLIGWYFFIYAFLGWCAEVVFAAINHGKFVNRGFLNGPICPIYGVGVVIVLILLEPVRDNFLLLYIGSVIITSVLELITGFILDKLFHKHWWDYSKEHFNIGGYICLKFSLIWGFACLIVVDIVHPVIREFVQLLPNRLSFIFLLVLIFAVISDVVITVLGINKTNKHLKLMRAVASELHEISDSIGSKISGKSMQMAEKYETAEAKHNKKREELVQKKAELQKKYNKMRNNMPMTGRRIQAAFPELKLNEHEVNSDNSDISKNKEKNR